MSEERSSNESGEKSWLGKIADAFSSEPKNRDEFLETLDAAEQRDIIDQDARQMIDGAMKMTELQVCDVMIPRPQMQVIKLEDSLEEVLPQIIESAHSRYPVIGENLDDVKGILLAKDLLPQLLKDKNLDFDIKELLRPVIAVPETKRLNSLLKEFRENRYHMAIVIDEYGIVAGLVTIEDVLEEIVGEIEDEHDDENDVFIKKLTDNDYIVKALTPIDDFNEYFSAKFSEEDFDTIGGIILQQFGHMPRRNEITVINSRYEFKVLNANNRQVHLLRLTLLPEEN